MDERLRQTEYVLLSSAADAEYWAWDLRLRDGGARVAVMPDPHEAFGYVCARARLFPRKQIRLVVDATDWPGFDDLRSAVVAHLPSASIWKRDGTDLDLIEASAAPPEIEITAAMPSSTAHEELDDRDGSDDLDDDDLPDDAPVAVTGAELEMLLGDPEPADDRPASPDHPDVADGPFGTGKADGTGSIEDEPGDSSGRIDDGGESL